MKNSIIIIQFIIIATLLIVIFILKIDTRPLFYTNEEKIGDLNKRTIEFREDFKSKITLYATRYVDYSLTEKRKINLNNGRVVIEYNDKAITIKGDESIEFKMEEGSKYSGSSSITKLNWNDPRVIKGVLPIFTLTYKINENQNIESNDNSNAKDSIERHIKAIEKQTKNEILKMMKNLNKMEESNRNSLIFTIEYN